jgi:hypothetical protein
VDKIPPSLPLQKGGIPLFEKEGLGEILVGAYLVNYGFLSKKNLPLYAPRGYRRAATRDRSLGYPKKNHHIIGLHFSGNDFSRDGRSPRRGRPKL